MTVNEYEERFRVPAPPLHETLVAAQSPKRRPWRFWAAVALAGGIMAASEVALPHSAQDGTRGTSPISHVDLGTIVITPAGRSARC